MRSFSAQTNLRAVSDLPVHGAGSSVVAAARTLVILPTYNEAENIGPLIEHLLYLEPSVNILVVDDGSPDGTANVVRRLQMRSSGRVFIEVRSMKLGRGNAVMHGFRFALAHGYEYVIEMDADFSHDPAAIPTLLTAAAGADLVIGSRHLPGGGARGWGIGRRCIHWCAAQYARLLIGTPTSDYTNGFRLYRVSALVALPLESVMAQGFVGQTLRAYLFHREGLRIREVPVVFHERRSGRSKMSWREAAAGAWALLLFRLRTLVK